MSVEARAAVEALARSSSASHRKVVQAKALLALADGASVRSTARAIGSHPDTVTRWRDRFVAEGVDGIGMIAPGRGRKPEIPPQVVEAIVHDTLHTVPDDGSVCWTTRAMAARHGVGKDTVADLAGTEVAAVAGRHVQAVERSALRGQAGRCRRALCGSAGTGGGVLLR